MGEFWPRIHRKFTNDTITIIYSITRYSFNCIKTEKKVDPDHGHHCFCDTIRISAFFPNLAQQFIRIALFSDILRILLFFG